MLKSFLTSANCFVFVSLFSLNLGAIQSVETATNDPSETSFCETKVEFHTDYAQAFAIAKRTGKPLFVLQLSGDLKNPTFT